ncbi:MAG: efflux RND transporter periplasmic adaptor subunit [Chromatiales bacterium]|nr:efflux RND transporter periplasmic adaptor subunit [Chromatiales bacterium]
MSDTTKSNANRQYRTAKGSIFTQWILIFLALMVLAAVSLYLFSAEDTIDVQQTEEELVAQPVSIETLSVRPETVEVASVAEVRPRWSAELRAAVSGRVDEVLDSALAGERVKAGTTLITIENSLYAAEMAAAELAVKEAQLALSKAEKATAIARKQYKRDGTKPPNDLALHLPELRIAETALKSARARVAASRQQLRDATIKAPFSGFITERFVSPGQSVNIGDSLVKLVDDTTFELTAELSRTDWLLLQQPLSGLTAKIVDQSGTLMTHAKIRQGGGFLNEKTRQYQVFLELKESGEASVLSGDFVRVLLPGITVPAALNIPESALTQEGYIWYLDEEDRLQRTSPQVLFRHQERVIVRAPDGVDVWRVAVTPLVSFLPGQQVHPQLAEN